MKASIVGDEGFHSFFFGSFQGMGNEVSSLFFQSQMVQVVLVERAVLGGVATAIKCPVQVITHYMTVLGADIKEVATRTHHVGGYLRIGDHVDA